jgi:ferredoxin--NADP+ reductase
MTDPETILNATVIERRDLTNTLAVIKIQPDGGQVPQFDPGQFIVVALPAAPPDGDQAQALAARRSDRPRLIRRAYSIASPPKVREHVELFLALVETGKLTPRLWTVEQGGRVWIDGKCTGDFTLDGVPADKDLVMVATGTGLAPFMSMLRQMRGSRRWRRFVLIHGVRFAADLGYRDELEATQRDDPSLLYIPTVTREPQESVWKGMRGRVQQVLDPEAYETLVGRPLSPQHSEVFLCGNPALIEDVVKLLEQLGFVQHTRKQPGNLHYERYWGPDCARSVLSSAFWNRRSTMRLRTITITLPALSTPAMRLSTVQLGYRLVIRMPTRL